MAVEVIECGDALEVANVNALHSQLLAVLSEQKHVAFNCSQIERVDTAALQMLYAFSKASSDYGCVINWDEASDVFIHNARLLGLASAMGMQAST